MRLDYVPGKMFICHHIGNYFALHLNNLFPTIVLPLIEMKLSRMVNWTYDTGLYDLHQLI
jgi:hypothetical protein